MEITPIGWLLIVAGSYTLLFRPQWLYILTIFFLPFTATAVVNVGSGYDVSGLQASMFLGCLLLLRHTMLVLWRGTLPLPRPSRTCLAWLGLFILSTAASLVMPVLLADHVRLPSQVLFDNSTTLLQLTSKNITGVLYMVFGFLFAYYIAVTTQKAEMLRLTLKCYMSGAAFAALWGMLQLYCKATSTPYPGWIFNTNKSISALASALALPGAYQQTLGVIRISSVSIEPSVFAQSLLIALTLCLPFVFGGYTLYSKNKDRTLFALLFFGIVITTSSLAYVGLGMIMGTALLLLALRGAAKAIYFAIPLACICVAAALYWTVPAVQRVLDLSLLSKEDTYSALERFMTIHNAYDMFRQHPWLGIGWASITSHDVVANILGNAGILGLLTFTAATIALLRELHKNMRKTAWVTPQDLIGMKFAFYIMTVVTLVTSILAGFLNVFTFYWYSWGLALAAFSWKADIEELAFTAKSSGDQGRDTQ